MSFREFVEKLDKEGKLVNVEKPVSRRLEASGLLKALETKVLKLNDIKESDFSVVGNIFGSKELIASYFGIKPEELIPKIIDAIGNPSKPEVVEEAPCQEVEMDEVDLDKVPILFHCQNDGGNYISSGVVIAKHPDFGQNIDFHRMMQIDKNKFSVRVVSKRHFDEFLQDQKKMDIAVCVGCGANVLLSAATSIDKGKDELEIANALEPLKVVKAKTSDLMIPADAEFVIEGTISLEEKANEGPFVDLTETQDIVRQEPVFTVKKITHRKDAIWYALLPGGLEHKIMMGMPREPTIFKKVNEAGIKCLDVSINPGGCSWLHSIIKIDKQNEDDGKKALVAAFDGHSSLKHAFVVDSDINILDPLEVEWAMATRFQGDKRIVIRGMEPGSSLDPSGEPGTKMTHKMGFDLTKPLTVSEGKNFEKAEFPKVNVKDFLD
ncbi:MAG: UbiD family decarboxylase [Candidatus Aenigmarchaeota archaeon]|nr:UbiD family decarboxylase [Candidatus Aenigmarchaeota archaeon]